MTLNKSTGLYGIPTHHLYGGGTPKPRPCFNSMDFAVNSPEPPKAKRGPGRPKKDSQKDSHNHSVPQEKVDRKKKKKVSLPIQDLQKASNGTLSTATPLIKVTPATVSTKGKKRKRESEAPVAQRRTLDAAVSLCGADMLKNIQSSVEAACEVFGSPPAPVQREEEPFQKKGIKDKASHKRGDTADFDLMAKEARRITKDAKKEKMAKRHSTGDVKVRPPAPARASAPSPPILSSPPSPTPVPIPHSSPAKAHVPCSPPSKTPVPLPPNAFSHRANALKSNRIGSRDASFLVLKTLESQLLKTPANLPDSPIPCKLTDVVKANKAKKLKKAAKQAFPSPGLSRAPSSAPPALDKSHRLQPKSDGGVSLTASNLQKYTTTTQPLSDEPKPRPRAVSRAASTAGSSTSDGTHPSVNEWFAHVGRPYSRSGAEVDPFVTQETKKKAPRETHEEASTKKFTERYEAAQKAVNFTDEAEYLACFLAWRKANNALGPLPCLGPRASGCIAKKENALRLICEDSKNPFKVVVTTEADAALLEDASQRALAAESLLAMSTAARIPIPIGVIGGTWKLFCAPYSATHADKYGYGQRTLSIYTVPGTQDPSLFTARLSIPPRSMLYQILSFEVPPHASFRSTVVKTSVKGHKMEVVFLGNGYLLLRADLRLLLSGKEAMASGGKKAGVMEFVGVHENAVVWSEREDELEAVGRKLFAKYDGKA